MLIGTRVSLRSPLELIGLVSAIVAASPNDETDWLEWKSGMDLGQKDSHVTIARHILGMASRQVAGALRQAGGCGYIVIGAEPGSVTGVTEVDRPASARPSRPAPGLPTSPMNWPPSTAGSSTWPTPAMSRG